MTRLARLFAALVFILSFAGLVAAFPVPEQEELPASAEGDPSPSEAPADGDGLPGSDPTSEPSTPPVAPAGALLPPSCTSSPARVPSAVAISTEGTVRLFTTAGDALGDFEGSGAPRWSVSGRYVGTDDAQIYSRSGDKVLSLFPDRVQSWVWSPASDCAFGVGKAGLFVGHPDGSRLLLHDVPSSQVATSPDGRVVVTAGGSKRRTDVRLTDLLKGKTKKYGVKGPAVFAGWQGDEAILRTKTGLFRLRRSGVKKIGSLSTGTGPVYPCHAGPLAAADGDLVSVLSDRTFASGFEEAACEPGGGFIAAVSSDEGDARELTALDSGGSVVAPLTTGEDGLADAAPLWGDGGEGVLFARSASTGSWELWRVPEGGRASASGVSFSAETPRCWSRVLAWSASPPAGYDVCASANP